MHRLLPSFVLSGLLLAAACGDSFESGPGGGGGGAGGTARPATCADVCAVRAALQCPGETGASCEASCVYTQSFVSWCKPVAGESIDCLAKEPAESFNCDGPDLKVNEGVCTAPFEAVTRCWYEGPEGGLPDLGAKCAAVCAASAELPCANPECVAECEAAIAETKSCNGAVAAWVQCAAAQPASSWHCSAFDRPELQGACGEYGLLMLACFGS